MLMINDNEREIRKKLYEQYVKELNENKTAEEQIEKEMNLRMDSPYVHWVDIYFDTNPIGFLTVGLLLTEREKADKRIMDAYVMPAFRRRHLASVTIRQYLKKYPGTYQVDILDYNYNIQKFWKTTFERNGYKLKSIEESWYTDDPDMATYTYGPRQEVSNGQT